MVEFSAKVVKDLGLDKLVYDSLPYNVVGGTWESSFQNPIAAGAFHIVSNYVVPSGKQLKILFLRIWTQEATGVRFSIFQTNTGYTVPGSVPSGVRDYPFLNAAGSEVLHGSLKQPIHVGEGSIDFRLLGPTPIPPNGSRYSLTWWGVSRDMAPAP